MEKILMLSVIVIYSLAIVFAYNRGIVTGVRIARTGSVERIKTTPVPRTMEETIARNIENYRGDGKGQLDFENK